MSKSEYQWQTDRLMAGVHNLDFTDFPCLVEFFKKLADLSVHGMLYDRELILGLFLKHGFRPEDSRELPPALFDDYQSHSTWLVSTALYCVRHGYLGTPGLFPDGAFSHQADMWQQKWHP